MRDKNIQRETPAADNVTVLSSQTAIRGGTFQVEHDLTVRGVLEGEVTVGGRIVVAPGAQVSGILRAKDAIIAGELHGEVDIGGTLIMKSTAVVDGNVRAARVAIEDGASGDVDWKVGSEDELGDLTDRREEARAELATLVDRISRRLGVVPAPGRQPERADRGSKLADDGDNALRKTADVADRPARDQANGRLSTDEMMRDTRMDEFLGGSDVRRDDRKSLTEKVPGRRVDE